MKKLIFLLAFLPLFGVAQIKIKDLPTTTTGSTGDFFLKDDVAGVAGSTKKISVSRVLSTYSIAIGKGTLYYLPKIGGTYTLTNSQIFDDGTYVGINTISPSYKLHVTSTSAGTAGLAVENTATSASTFAAYKCINNLGSSYNFGVTSSGYTPTGSLLADQSFFTTDAANGLLFNNSSNDIVFSVGTQAKLTIKNGGDIGIGISPSYKLDVLKSSVGDILNLSATGGATWRATSGASLFTIGTSGGTADQLIQGGTNVLYQHGGFCSVGPSNTFPTPTAMLHVGGSGSTSGTYALKIENSSADNILNVRNDGLVGIGSAPSYKLHVVSSAAASPVIVAENSATGSNTYSAFRVINNLGHMGTYGLTSSGNSTSGIYTSDQTFIGNNDAANGLLVYSSTGDIMFAKPTTLVEEMRLKSTGVDITGNLALTTAGNGIKIKEGSNATMGVATLSGGTIVVNTTAVTANSRIFVTVQGGTLTNVGSTYISARTAGTSFTISSSNVLDASNVAWVIIEPN